VAFYFVPIRELLGDKVEGPWRFYFGCPEESKQWLNYKNYRCADTEDDSPPVKVKTGQRVSCMGDFDCSKSCELEGGSFKDGKSFFVEYDGTFKACKLLCLSSIFGDVQDDNVICDEGWIISYKSNGDCIFAGRPGHSGCTFMRRDKGARSAMYCGAT